MPTDVSKILYSEINNIGMERIRIDISNNIEASERYSRELFERCTKMLGSHANDETLATFSEALIHFMLTACALPSERKVSFRGVNLDIVIPSVKVLQKNQEKALIIQILKNNDDIKKVTQAESIQLVKGNIWIVSSSRTGRNHRNYHLGNGQMSFYRIIRDIHSFVADKGLGRLKLIHGD